MFVYGIELVSSNSGKKNSNNKIDLFSLGGVRCPISDHVMTPLNFQMVACMRMNNFSMDKRTIL